MQLADSVQPRMSGRAAYDCATFAAMRKAIIIVALLVAIGAGAFYALTSGGPPAVSGVKGDEATSHLEKGEILLDIEAVEGSDTPRVNARAMVKAPPEKLWKIIDDCSRYKDTMVRIGESQELSREGDTVTCRTTVDMPFPLSNLTATTRAVHTVEPGKLYKREWNLVEGDYKVNTGSWTLTPFEGDPNRTLVEYVLHADPTTSIPDAIKEAAQKKSIPDLIEKLRKDVE